jgi:hypothetical protein
VTQNAQASVYCVGMYPLPECSTHAACVGVLCRRHLFKCEDAKGQRGNSRRDDIYLWNMEIAHVLLC